MRKNYAEKLVMQLKISMVSGRLCIMGLNVRKPDLTLA